MSSPPPLFPISSPNAHPFLSLPRPSSLSIHANVPAMLHGIPPWRVVGIQVLCPYAGIYTVTVQIRGPLVYTGIIVYFASTFAGHYVKMSDATPPERREDALGTL